MMMEETIVQDKESKWYVLRVVSGKERKIKEYLDKENIQDIEIEYSNRKVMVQQTSFVLQISVSLLKIPIELKYPLKFSYGLWVYLHLDLLILNLKRKNKDVCFLLPTP